MSVKRIAAPSSSRRSDALTDCRDGQVQRRAPATRRLRPGSGVTTIAHDARAPAPDFGGPTLDGASFDSTRPGSVVVLNVWGSWCPPSQEERPKG